MKKLSAIALVALLAATVGMAITDTRALAASAQVNTTRQGLDPKLLQAVLNEKHHGDDDECRRDGEGERRGDGEREHHKCRCEREDDESHKCEGESP